MKVEKRCRSILTNNFTLKLQEELVPFFPQGELPKESDFGCTHNQDGVLIFFDDLTTIIDKENCNFGEIKKGIYYFCDNKWHIFDPYKHIYTGLYNNPPFKIFENEEIEQRSFCSCLKGAIIPPDIHDIKPPSKWKYLNVITKKEIQNKIESLKDEHAIVEDLTIGIEFELFLKKNFVPIKAINLGLAFLYDGSVPGKLEYVSGIIPSKKITSFVENINPFLQEAEAQKECSLHVHMKFKDRAFTKKEIVDMYLFYYLLQDNIYSLFPKFIEHPNIIEKKEYSERIFNLGFNNRAKILNQEEFTEHFYKKIRALYLGNLNDLNTLPEHRKRTRYSSLNLVEAFNGGTVEFRVHPSTKNPQRILFWINLLQYFMKVVNDPNNSIYENFKRGKKISFDTFLPLEMVEKTEEISNKILEKQLRVQQIMLDMALRAGDNSAYKDYIEDYYKTDEF